MHLRDVPRYHSEVVGADPWRPFAFTSLQTQASYPRQSITLLEETKFRSTVWSICAAVRIYFQTEFIFSVHSAHGIGRFRSQVNEHAKQLRPLRGRRRHLLWRERGHMFSTEEHKRKVAS